MASENMSYVPGFAATGATASIDNTSDVSGVKLCVDEQHECPQCHETMQATICRHVCRKPGPNQGRAFWRCTRCGTYTSVDGNPWIKGRNCDGKFHPFKKFLKTTPGLEKSYSLTPQVPINSTAMRFFVALLTKCKCDKADIQGISTLRLTGSSVFNGARHVVKFKIIRQRDFCFEVRNGAYEKPEATAAAVANDDTAAASNGEHTDPALPPAKKTKKKKSKPYPFYFLGYINYMKDGVRVNPVRDDGTWVLEIEEYRFATKGEALANAIASLFTTPGREPMEVLGAMGKLLGDCCVCGHPLSDPQSIATGMGPVCGGRVRAAAAAARAADAATAFVSAAAASVAIV